MEPQNWRTFLRRNPDASSESMFALSSADDREAEILPF
jgi:hypothetical protein